MTTTITKGLTVITPSMVIGYESSRESRNVIHDLIGGGISITLRPASLRSGTLEMLFRTEEAAAAAEALHISEGVFTLSDSDIPTADMRYVVGSIRRALDDTRTVWLLSVGFQEVTA